jgi:hypothetical protein
MANTANKTETLRLVVSPARKTQIQIPKGEIKFFVNQFGGLLEIWSPISGVNDEPRQIKPTFLKANPGKVHTYKLEIPEVAGRIKPTVVFTRKGDFITYTVAEPLQAITLSEALSAVEDITESVASQNYSVDSAFEKLTLIAARVASSLPGTKFVVPSKEDLQETYDSYESSESDYSSSYESSYC